MAHTCQSSLSLHKESYAMSRGLTYDDLNASEQCQYHTIVRHRHAHAKGGEAWRENLQETSSTRDAPALQTHTHTPSRPRNFLASVQCVYDYGKTLFERYRRQPRERQGVVDLVQFIRTQAAARGFDTFERASFPNFPAEIEPFPPR